MPRTGRCDTPNGKFNKFRRKKDPIALATAHRSWGPKKDGRNRSNARRRRLREQEAFAASLAVI